MFINIHSELAWFDPHLRSVQVCLFIMNEYSYYRKHYFLVSHIHIFCLTQSHLKYIQEIHVLL